MHPKNHLSSRINPASTEYDFANAGMGADLETMIRIIDRGCEYGSRYFCFARRDLKLALEYRQSVGGERQQRFTRTGLQDCPEQI